MNYAGKSRIQQSVDKFQNLGIRKKYRCPIQFLIRSSGHGGIPAKCYGIGHTHLDYYLDEFTFRFNRRTSKSRGKLSYRLIQQEVQVEAITYDQIIGGKTDKNGPL